MGANMTTAKKKSPTARALEQLRKDGYTAQVVERWNPFAKRRVDLFGFCDLIYLTAADKDWYGNIVAVQVTTGTNHAARRTKTLAEPRALKWIQSGGLIEIWSYTLAGPRGKAKVWTLRKEELVAEDFQ